MIYFALRVSENYFQKLALLRATTSDHALISISTGAAYLHAISPYTKALHIVDPDPVSLLYNRMVIELIKNAPSRDAFIEIMCGHSVVYHNSEWKLFEPVNQSERAWEALRNTELYMFFMNTIGRWQVFPNLYRALNDEQTILFKGWSLTSQTFSWRFGEGAFKSEETFKVLQQSLTKTETRFIQGTLESIPYSEISTDTPLCILTSNMESPLFSKGDCIFTTIAKNVSVATRYISWHRDVMTYPEENWQEWIGPLIQKRTGNSIVSVGQSIKTIIPSATLHETLFNDIAELESAQLFGQPLLFVDFSSMNRDQSNMQRLQKVTAPCFAKLCGIGNSNGATLLALMEQTGFFESYTITYFEQNSSKFFLELSLKGTYTK